MDNFVWNPQYMPYVERAILRALENRSVEARRAAKRNTNHPSIARGIVSDRPKREANGEFSVKVRYSKGLGPIFEGGTRERFTRNGAARGRIHPPERALKRALDEVAAKGVDLGRYL